eukprot:CAMPEP_0177613256 /NCGR_PEP_ID=MMETSP0419_2-20121207/21832_1 /TAXON_ID=582737 /ORGANISM="Tetraselmis sp., Strain GSL018" /LENGTH=108 /DNA_ID=CAMNT_0019109849 /DNA_START=131 /DNA_END=453 /DNA_ORIENTATION=-
MTFPDVAFHVSVPSTVFEETFYVFATWKGRRLRLTTRFTALADWPEADDEVAEGCFVACIQRKDSGASFCSESQPIINIGRVLWAARCVPGDLVRAPSSGSHQRLYVS